MIVSWPWLAVVAMGAYHGLNPAMGWLFAVSLGLQERSRKKVVAALFPIAGGHLLSIAAVVALLAWGALAISPKFFQLIGGTALMLFGGFRLFSSRLHYRWVGMRVSSWDLVVWSFLMASADGAGLMLFPVLLNLPICTTIATAASPGAPAASGLDLAMARTALRVVMLHTVAMLAVMGPVAILVYDWIGLGILRKAWINVDKLWAATLMGSGLIVLVI
jgi:hypothetical protein